MASQGYSTSQKALHWLMFLLIAGLYGMTFFEDVFPRGNPSRGMFWMVHKSFGLLVLALLIWRISLRLSKSAPDLPESSTFERFLAHGIHLALYALILVVPLLGMGMTWLKGRPVTFFDLFAIPSPFEANKDAADALEDMHEVAANLMLLLVAVHVAAALWHYFARKDNVLMRMSFRE